MKITDVKVFPVDEDKLKAYATITFDNSFIVRDLKVISGNKGFFIAMPSKKRKDGTFRDVAHPLNSETRKMIEDAVLDIYNKEAASGPTPVRYSESAEEEITAEPEAAPDENTPTAVEEEEKPEKRAEDNPAIEPADDPDKAFGYEE
jgi:stage V sporulation protein G